MASTSYLRIIVAAPIAIIVWSTHMPSWPAGIVQQVGIRQTGSMGKIACASDVVAYVPIQATVPNAKLYKLVGLPAEQASHPHKIVVEAVPANAK